jgi:peptidoglycan/LPS O-acetylase OafA/YrhL
MTPERPGFRSDVEGLRRVATLLVVGVHATFSRAEAAVPGERLVAAANRLDRQR